MARRRVLLILVLTSFFSVVSPAVGQNSPTADERVLAGNWKVTLHPYAGPEFESMPLQVISVIGTSSYDANGFWIRERRLRNRSDKRVSRAAFTAFVYREESPETLLFQHPLHRMGFSRVPVLAGTEWPAPCSEPPKYCPYGHAIPGVRKLLAQLVKDGTLEGQYRIAIGVSKVWFEDGSTWELPGSQPQAPHYMVPEPPLAPKGIPPFKVKPATQRTEPFAVANGSLYSIQGLLHAEPFRLLALSAGIHWLPQMVLYVRGPARGECWNPGYRNCSVPCE